MKTIQQIERELRLSEERLKIFTKVHSETSYTKELEQKIAVLKWVLQ